MKKTTILILITALQSFLVLTANATVLATEQLLTPLIPDSKKSIDIYLSSLDPKKPVWVIYQLVGVSANDKPEGEIIFDSSFEMVALPMSDSVVVFRTKNLTVVKSTKGLVDQLKEKVGDRSPEELRKMFGDDMYAAYEAINRSEGSYVTGSMLKEYQTEGKRDVKLMTTVDRAVGIQPVLINVIAGQGDIPPEYEKLSKKRLSPEKLITAIISFAIAGLWLFKRRRN